MSQDTNTDVLIVGSGPTGLVAALTLVQNGISVRVVEKLSEFPIGQRGAGIMPRTLEIYNFLRVLEDVMKMSIKVPDFLEWKDSKPGKTFPMTPYEEPTPASPIRNTRVLGQDAACRILRNHLKAHGVEVELSKELVDLKEDEDHVTVDVIHRQVGQEIREVITAKYVIGADGARGITRKLLKLPFLGETRDSVHLIIGDVEAHGLDPDHWHLFEKSSLESLFLRPSDRTASADIFFLGCCGPNLDYPRALEDHDYLRQYVHDFCGVPELKIGRVEAIANYRPNIRLVSSFRMDRVFIAGDAAHVHSATGGQGMNSSVMDAFNLSWKLALAVKGLALPALLDSYTGERLPVIKEMLQRTTDILNKTFDESRKDSEDSPWKRAPQLSQLGVHYRWSPVVVDEYVAALETTDTNKAQEVTASTYVVEEGGRLQAGDRAPDAPVLLDSRTGVIRRLFDVFGPDHHTVLVFEADTQAMASDLEPLARYPVGLIRSVIVRPQGSSSPVDSEGADLVLDDKEGHAYAAYGSTRIAIVRPDGVVGALVGGAEGVKKYFSGILTV